MSGGTTRSAGARWMVAALVGAAGMPAMAQSWERQTPLPTSMPLYSVAFTSPTHGFVVALNGTVCETSDGGQTWVKRMGQGYSTEPMYKVVFSDAMHGYIAGNPGGEFNKRTVDGGQTWLPMPQLNLGSTYFLDFVTPTVGFASPGGFGVGFTNDGGATWQTRLHSPSIQWFGMDFYDQTTGLVGGREFSTQPEVSGLFKTTDGGLHFTHVFDKFGFPMFLSATEAIAIGVESDYFTQQSIVYTHRSHDGGSTWATTASFLLPEYDSFFRVVHVSGEVYCGVSAIGTVWRTVNSGATWNKVNQGLGIPFIANVWADITFLDAQHGWSVNSSGVIVTTDNGGETWRIISAGVNGQVGGISMDESGFGVAAAGGQIVELTTDGGAHWNVRRIQTFGNQFGFAESIETAFVLDADTAIVGGKGGLLYRTIDAGESWQNIGFVGSTNYPVWAEAADIEFGDEFDGWVATRDGVFHTINGGVSWDLVPDPLPNWGIIGGAIELEGEASVFVMPEGADIVWRSNDHGRTWEYSQIMEGALQLRDISFASPLVGWAVGAHGGSNGYDAYIAKTIDGGVTWTMQYTSEATVNFKPHIVFDVEAISQTTVRALATENDRPVVLTSTNGGQTWVRDVHPSIVFPEVLDNLAVTDSGDAWIAGFGGIIEHKAGSVACRPDVTTTALVGSSGYGVPNGVVNNDDFFYFLGQFAAGNLAVADMTTTAIVGSAGYGVPNGAITNDDFFFYLTLFAAGCR